MMHKERAFWPWGDIGNGMKSRRGWHLGGSDSNG